MSKPVNQTPPRSPRLIELADGLAVQPHAIGAIRRSSLNEDKCVVFLKGQSAVDGGFLVDRDYDGLLDEINDSLDPDEED